MRALCFLCVVPFQHSSFLLFGCWHRWPVNQMFVRMLSLLTVLCKLRRLCGKKQLSRLSYCSAIRHCNTQLFTCIHNYITNTLNSLINAWFRHSKSLIHIYAAFNYLFRVDCIAQIQSIIQLRSHAKDKNTTILETAAVHLVSDICRPDQE